MRTVQNFAKRIGIKCPALAACLMIAVLPSFFGCGSWSPRLGLLQRNFPPTPNPALVPATLEEQFVWQQTIDVVDDYFHIQTEQPVQRHMDVSLEGKLETTYRPGAGVLEPWRRDSTLGFERWQSTLQSIRRKAIVYVRPQQSGYEIEVIVLKELEDVNRSQQSGASAAAQRHDGTVVRTESQVDTEQITLGWIPQGRDPSLEQIMVADIVGRLTGPEGRRLLHH